MTHFVSKHLRPYYYCCSHIAEERNSEHLMYKFGNAILTNNYIILSCICIRNLKINVSFLIFRPVQTYNDKTDRHKYHNNNYTCMPVF